MSAPEISSESPATAPATKQPSPDGNATASTAKKWTIRGIPDEVRESVSQAARLSGTTIGDIVTDALLAHLADLETGTPSHRDLAAEFDDFVHYCDERMTEIERNMKAQQPHDFKLRLVERPWIRPVTAS
jgi:hypothetical protein